ncbi:MAG: hypothetical protein RR224_07790 [Clostridia bacterium]
MSAENHLQLVSFQDFSDNYCTEPTAKRQATEGWKTRQILNGNSIFERSKEVKGRAAFGHRALGDMISSHGEKQGLLCHLRGAQAPAFQTPDRTALSAGCWFDRPAW